MNCRRTGRGIAALSMLNIMEHFRLADYGHNSAAALHVMIEAKKLAYADMVRYVGDRGSHRSRCRRCCRRSWESSARRLVQMDKASCQVVRLRYRPEAQRTRPRDDLHVHYRQGRQHRLAHSEQLWRLWHGHGPHRAAGFSFHNRGAGFELIADKPNSLAGHKRPLHTIIPAFMRKDDVAIGLRHHGRLEPGARHTRSLWPTSSTSA